MIELNNYDNIVSYRKELHKIAELSGSEIKTAIKIKEILKQYSPDKIIENIGGNGIAAVFGSTNKSKIMIRAELDALPISEVNNFDHKSFDKFVSHKCGHDGHMAILLGLADYLSRTSLDIQVILLFQPSEENGKGATQVINDDKFSEIKPDFVLALHNLPGFKKNLILLKEDLFASASVGMIINLKGISTHAAHPEDGISPTKAVSNILKEILELNNSKEFDDFSLATPIFTKLGEKAFGTAPHTAEILLTLRAYRDSDLELLKGLSTDIVKRNSEEQKLAYEISWDDPFSSTVNDSYVISMIKKSCKENEIDFIELEEPFRWSEDFGVFTHQIRGAIFGIGSGEKTPQLHNPDYDFPDEIIPTAVRVLLSTINNLKDSKNK